MSDTDRMARLHRNPTNRTEYISVSQVPTIDAGNPVMLGIVLEWKHDDTKASLTKRFRELLQFCKGLEEGE